jgi:hypothetical protein
MTELEERDDVRNVDILERWGEWDANRQRSITERDGWRNKLEIITVQSRPFN